MDPELLRLANVEVARWNRELDSFTQAVLATAVEADRVGAVINVDGFELSPLDAARWALFATLLRRGRPIAFGGRAAKERGGA